MSAPQESASWFLAAGQSPAHFSAVQLDLYKTVKQIRKKNVDW